jgi:transcriptional regulator with XRE-family HTH domain
VAKESTKNYVRDDAFLLEIGKKIRDYRTKAGMTQMDLAFKCADIDYSQINRMELGKVNFSVSYLSIIAQALRIDPKELLP